MIAEGDVTGHRDVERDFSFGVGAKRIRVHHAPQLDLADLAGGHACRGHVDGVAGPDSAGVHRDGRRRERNLAQPKYEQEHEDRGDPKDHAAVEP